MNIEKEKLNKAKEELDKIKQDFEKNILNLEEVLDSLVIERNKKKSANECFLEIELIMSDALKQLPTRMTKQRYLSVVLNNEKKYSQIEKQIDLIFFKRILRRKYGLTVSPGGNDKLLDMKFADALNIPTPSVYQQNITLDNVSFEKAPFVLKPTYGSNAKNVFYVHSISKIVEAKSARCFDSISAMKSYISASGYNKTWQTEQLMTGVDGKPSTDLKVYAYYGETGGVMEVLREDKTYRCWYSPEGKILESENLKTEWFNGNGFSPKLLEYASKIALATPTPFLRIDFYQDENDYYLGEITPHPGKYYTEYSNQVDSQLGRCFVEAEARLFADLIKGKKFDLYFDTYKGYLK